MELILLYLLLVNAAGFSLMLVDKAKARKNKWRIPEATLLAVALVGGSIGSLIGMKTVRHKTKKPVFYIGIPFIIALQVLLAVIILIQKNAIR